MGDYKIKCEKCGYEFNTLSREVTHYCNYEPELETEYYPDPHDNNPPHLLKRWICDECYHKIGDIVKGVVTGIQPYGAFIVLDNEINGLIHISEISDKFVRSIEDYVNVGDTISVRILEIDYETNHAKLSLKNVENSSTLKNVKKRGVSLI